MKSTLIVLSSLLVLVSTQKAPQDVLIDTDAGGDAALAIPMLLNNRNINVIGITCVTGNSGVHNVTRNVLKILQVTNRTDIPVFVGGRQGLAYRVKSDNFFGFDGFGNMDPAWKPALSKAQQTPAAIAMGQIINSKPGKISVLVLGPMTNLALALHLYPNILHNANNIIVLGGAYKGRGNVKPGVEFSIYADPEAATFVFSNLPKKKTITLFPVETSVDNFIPMDWRRNVLGKINSRVVSLLNVAERVSLENSDSWVPYDAMGAAVIIDPSIVSTVPTFVLVETCGQRGRGATFFDYETSHVNVQLITTFNTNIFKNMILNSVQESH